MLAIGWKRVKIYMLNKNFVGFNLGYFIDFILDSNGIFGKKKKKSLKLDDKEGKRENKE